MLRQFYRIARSLVFTLTLVVIGLYLALYILISIPQFQQFLKNIAVSQLTELLDSRVEIDQLKILPFNEVVVRNISVYDKEGNKCVGIETVGAGIHLWKLLTSAKIELTYGEIIGLHADIVQKEKGGDLNIRFLIDAFSSKTKDEEKKHFDITLRNVVLRKSSLTFTRQWIEENESPDLRMIEVENLKADIAFPKISDQGVEVDLRRLSMELKDIIEVKKLAFRGIFQPDGFSVKNLTVELPGSRIFMPSTDIFSAPGENLTDVFKKDNLEIVLTDSYITPDDFSFFFPPLTNFNQKLPLEISAHGNLNHLQIDNLEFGNSDLIQIILSGNLDSVNEINSLSGDLSEFKVSLSSLLIEKILSYIKSLPERPKKYLGQCGDINFTGEGAFSLAPLSITGKVNVDSEELKFSADGNYNVDKIKDSHVDGSLKIEKLNLQALDPAIAVENIKGDVNIDIDFISDRLPEGAATLIIENFKLKNKSYEGLTLNVSNNEGKIEGDLSMNNNIGNIGLFFSGYEDELKRTGVVTCEIERLNLSEVMDMKFYEDFLIKGDLSIEGSGRDLNDMEGELVLEKFSFTSPDNSRSLKMNRLEIEAGVVDSLRSISIDCDWFKGNLNGKFKFGEIAAELTGMMHDVLPALIPSGKVTDGNIQSEIELQLVLKTNNNPFEFFNLPYRLLVPVVISGNIEPEIDNANLAIDIPYLQQGKDKLIYDTRLIVELEGNTGELHMVAETNLPVKRGDLSLSLNLSAQDDQLFTYIWFQNTENPDFKGALSFEGNILKNKLSLQPEVNVNFNPTVLSMGTTDWNLDRCRINYLDKKVNIDGLSLWHEDQFVKINGVASSDYADVLKIDLADINVDYIFEMLAINYVTFGGIATGEVAAHGILGSEMSAETETLRIKDFSYNGAVLGDCEVSSRWNNEEKEVEIYADISKGEDKRVKASGGVWITRDSLSFDIGAMKVPVEFIQPFMSVFSSHVGGFATGDIKLFGTFKDIDLIGKVFADSVAMKLDYTNTVYHGSDTIYMYPGKIEIPSFRLYDRYGNSGLLSGELNHKYFHEPTFTFRLSEAENLLCYDTNQDINPEWFGTLYGTGSAIVNGEPGIVDISADMTISGSSAFTFVLDDTQYANDYQFLTFSDRRAAPKVTAETTSQDFKTIFKKKKQEEQGVPSRFGIDIRASVTPSALFTLVMDPAAGDKITARGRGAMQVKYESDNDEMQMYGKYEIEEGNYNFSLQDIILRDFKIKEGSSISFNGNPLTADLDISAAYRVNTNLSDLDKSFSSDRDLARTNVPVDAILMVKGDMQKPEITFDVELPTLTQDVERKVKSIISTDDMMNRQIIYLLALNRFYTPEYMGSSSNGSELAAVASSTLSSQLSNILGQLTDKVSVSPSFRSDKGDFSDIEVDVALSSRLLNNRLLINGNFGYRDKNNSSTTFVGDFDVEYLLSRNGNLRLKAYNHFNDQNYYLREALTTQGLGVVWRKDFDTLFPFLKKDKKKPEEEPESSENEK